MKTIPLLLSAICLYFISFSQAVDSAQVKPLVIEDITKNMSKGAQPGFKIDVHEAKKKGTVDALTKAMKDENKSKLELVNNEYIVRNAIVKNISSVPLNVYCMVNEYEDKVEIYFFFEKDSVFLTKENNESEYIAARKYTRDFAVRAYKGAVQERIDEENKKLKDMESEFSKIVKENENLHKKISEEKRNIESINNKISTSKLDQERVRKQVQSQKEQVSQSKSTGNEAVVKAEEKKLKSLEGEVSKLEKQEDGFHKDVTKSGNSIRDFERQISSNEATLARKQEEIADQKQHIVNLQKKMNSIK